MGYITVILSPLTQKRQLTHIYSINPLLLFVVLLWFIVGCTGGTHPLPNFDPTVEVVDKEMIPQKSMNAVVGPTTTTEISDSSTNSKFTNTSSLCNNLQGPDCKNLRLGDEYFTTVSPAIGYLYSCTPKNPDAPGSVESMITWINFANETWNFFKKLWLPPGTFNPAIGTYSETLSDDTRQINITNLPVDGKIGDWPMTNYPTLTIVDGNPGIPVSHKSSFSYPLVPSETTFPRCVSPGSIGVTKNGIVIYHAADARGEDAVAREIVDIFGGHPAMINYHYHFIPERLDNESLSDGHSGIVGYINDGFPIYGYKGEEGIEMSNNDLDLCHGHRHGPLGYHYHATLEYPYTIGCYMGTPVSGSSNGIDPPDRRPKHNGR